MLEMIVGLEHIGIAVNSIDQALTLYEKLLGLKPEKIMKSSKHKIRAAFLKVGATEIELLEPLDEESPIGKFLKKRGQGIHHVAFRVENIETKIEQLKRQGVIMIDEKPRAGIGGGKIAFLHPKSTGNVLIELCEH
jgi:methylmalonyl-CoA/ethylmalonyl-CoA epimerase